MTVGQKWRFRRNLIIALAHEHGASQRLLADVFDLPRSHIAQIIRQVDFLRQAGLNPATGRAEGPVIAGLGYRRRGRETPSID